MSIKLIVQKIFSRPKASSTAISAFRFAGRVTANDLMRLAREALGRPMTRAEREAVLEGFRPQGLLDDADTYRIIVASPRYFGRSAPELEISPTAVGGYANGDQTVLLTESAAIHYREGGEDHLDYFDAPFAA